MGKTTAPLLSIGASGQVGKTQVYSSWRGIPYVRRHVVPANPNTSAQQATRTVFGFLTGVWKQAPSLFTAPWDLYAKGQPLTGRNAFIGQNTKVLRSQTTLTALIGSPGAKGGLNPTSIAVAAVAGGLTVTFVNPTAPTGWTLTAAVAAAIKDGDPSTSTDYLITAAEDTTTKNSVALAGLSAVPYRVVGWLQWTKADGSTAYSTSLSGTGTPT